MDNEELDWSKYTTKLVAKMASFGNHSGQNELVDKIGRIVFSIVEDADTRIASLEAHNEKLRSRLCPMCEGVGMIGAMTAEGGDAVDCPECEAQLKEREWISVDKALPDNIQNVVVYANDIVMSWRETAWYGNGCWHTADKEEMYAPIVTHWMPLPSPPES